MRSCMDCRFYSPAPAGPSYDRCSHLGAKTPTMTASANRAGTDKCRWMRRFFFGACGLSANLFEEKS